MDKKTAGQVHFEAVYSGYGLFWDEQDESEKYRHERIAAAVIAHVRPQIEAEARACAVEDAAIECEARAEDGMCIATGIRELAPLPSGHCVVPVEPTMGMQKAASGMFYDQSFFGKMSIERAEMVYKAMIAGKV